MTAGEIQNWIEGVLDGTYADDLHSQKVRADENLVYTYGVMQLAKQMGSEGKSLYDQSTYTYEMVLRAKQSVQAAINAYSKLANDIQTYSYGKLAPPQLAGLSGLGNFGALGIAPAIITLAAIGAVTVSVTAFAYAYGKAKSDSQAAVVAIQSTSQLVDSLKAAGVSSAQIADIVENLPKPPGEGIFSSLTSGIGTIVLVAALGLGAYFLSKKKGYIK
mgnify:CR=1 FL=1